MKVEHYFVYWRQNGDVFYERTCGTVYGAQFRVRELRQSGRCAFYQADVIPNAFY